MARESVRGFWERNGKGIVMYTGLFMLLSVLAAIAMGMDKKAFLDFFAFNRNTFALTIACGSLFVISHEVTAYFVEVIKKHL